MKNLKHLATLAATILVAALPNSALAQHGGSDGGGGKGVVCRNPNGSIKSVELLDMWEAREIYKHKSLASRLPVSELVKAGIARLKGVTTWDGVRLTPHGLVRGEEAFALSLTDISTAFQDSKNNDVVRLNNASLTPTEDSFEVARPMGCEIQNIVVAKDLPMRRTFLVSNALYDKMNNVNRAALILHEALYSLLRTEGEKNSIRARRAVGYVMSGGTFQSVESLLIKPYVKCVSQKTAEAEEGSLAKIYFTPLWNQPGIAPYAVVIEKIAGRKMMGYVASVGGMTYGHSLRELKRSLFNTYETSGELMRDSPVDYDQIMSTVSENGTISVSGTGIQFGGPVNQAEFAQMKCETIE